MAISHHVSTKPIDKWKIGADARKQRGTQSQLYHPQVQTLHAGSLEVRSYHNIHEIYSIKVSGRGSEGRLLKFKCHLLAV